MQNFTFHNPTRLIFGKGQIDAIASEVPAGAKVLLVTGGGSIRANGVYDRVIKNLAPRKVVEFWGVEANPDYDTLMKAVELGRKEKIDYILSVGGGSALDGAKFIAAAIPFEGDAWQIILTVGSCIKTDAIPLGAVLTLPATGSEANPGAVISRRALKEKLFFMHPSCFPKFSILDPETTYSLPLTQVANGIADAFTHVLEQYLTYPVGAAIQDRFAESVLKVLIEEGPKCMTATPDYASRANWFWAATWALNGAIGAGVPHDWATHTIGHEITALHGVDHARTLAVVMPSLLDLERDARKAKLLQYAERVWDLRTGSEDERIQKAIDATRGFYEVLGIATRLSAYGITLSTAKEVARRLEARGSHQFGDRNLLTPAKAEKILANAA